MSCTLLPIDGDWMVAGSPVQFNVLTPTPGVTVASSSTEIVLNRVGGAEKSVSVLFSPGGGGNCRFGTITIASSAKFCEIYIQNDSKEWTYVETCRGVLFEGTIFRCHHEGAKNLNIYKYYHHSRFRSQLTCR